MASLWRRLGLRDVEQTSITIRMEFTSFEGYWQPFTTGEGGPGQFMRACPTRRERRCASICNAATCRTGRWPALVHCHRLGLSRTLPTGT